MNIALTQALIFLIKTASNLYFVILLLRFLTPIFRLSFYNPVIQWVLLVSNPVLNPLQKVIPKHPRIDIACLIAGLLLKVIEFMITSLLTFGFIPHLLSLTIWPIGEVLSQTINIFFFATIMVTVLSWLKPDNQNPLTDILNQITEPLLRPARKLIAPTMNIDFSPILVLISLKLIEILIAQPLIQLGLNLLHGY